MYDIYILFLIASIAVLAQCTSFFYFSKFSLWLGMAKLGVSEERRIISHSIKNASDIFTSVFLGVAFIGADFRVNSVFEAIFVVVFLLWLVNSLLWQRVPVASVELGEERAEGRRLAIQIFLILCWVYFPWSLMWYYNRNFSMIGIVLFVDLVLQLYLRALLRQDQRHTKDPKLAAG